jgi:hypothetical protein
LCGNIQFVSANVWRQGPFIIDPLEGQYFMVHNMGPYQAVKLQEVSNLVSVLLTFVGGSVPRL